MARKDSPENSEPVSEETTEQQTPLQVISDSQLINLKLDRIIELLSQK